MIKPDIQEHYDDAGDLIKDLYALIRYYEEKEGQGPPQVFMIAERQLVGPDLCDTQIIPLVGFGYFTELHEVEKKLDEIETAREMGQYEDLEGLEVVCIEKNN